MISELHTQIFDSKLSVGAWIECSLAPYLKGIMQETLVLIDVSLVNPRHLHRRATVLVVCVCVTRLHSAKSVIRLDGWFNDKS